MCYLDCVIRRASRYALRPTPAQAERLRAWIGATRFVYNLCLEQRRDFWRQYRRQTGRNLSWAQQSKEVTDLRMEAPWLADVPRCALEQAIRDLDKAMSAFFSGRANHPTPRRKFENDSIRFPQDALEFRRLNAKWSAVRIPRIGWVKYRDTRAVAGERVNVTVKLKAGQWSIAIAHQRPEGEASPASAQVGVDRGIAQTITLSTGEVMQAPSLAKIEAKKRRAQRAMARRKRGSARRAAARTKVTRVAGRKAAMLTDWSHKASTSVARRFGLVAVEDLKIASMTASGQRKRGLNRSILEQAWGRFASQLAYKLSERGGVLISVPAAHTSQTCAGCGVVDARSRKSQAVFACAHCGHTDNADVNAAREILRRSTALLDVEGSHWRPDEASIMAAA